MEADVELAVFCSKSDWLAGFEGWLYTVFRGGWEGPVGSIFQPELLQRNFAHLFRGSSP